MAMSHWSLLGFDLHLATIATVEIIYLHFLPWIDVLKIFSVCVLPGRTAVEQLLPWQYLL